MANSKILLIAGSFNDEGGKPSGYIKKLAESLKPLIPGEWEILNGGQWGELESVVHNQVPQTHVVLWFPDVPNDKKKLIEGLKELNPKMMLVTSKNNREGKYERLHLISRALKAKANLLVEFTNSFGKVAATIHDPLANMFCRNQTDVTIVATALAKRLTELAKFTRVKSIQVGEQVVCPDTPELTEFFDVVKGYSAQFHTLVHAINQERMLGNVSFRCESGFPSFRHDNGVFVSRRNLDKRLIGPEGFVAVDISEGDVVQYFGEHKPSVDTPIQVKLYRHFEKANFMLHGHVYIEGAPFTNSIVPCGAIEEFDEIAHLFPDRNAAEIIVNLKGHGSIAIVDDWRKLKTLPYVSRDRYDNELRPEIFQQYGRGNFAGKFGKTNITRAA